MPGDLERARSRATGRGAGSGARDDAALQPSLVVDRERFERFAAELGIEPSTSFVALVPVALS